MKSQESFPWLLACHLSGCLQTTTPLKSECSRSAQFESDAYGSVSCASDSSTDWGCCIVVMHCCHRVGQASRVYTRIN